MKKERVNQIDVLYPYFRTDGRKIAAFYRYQLFTDNSERVTVPMLGKVFEGPGWETRRTAHDELEKAFEAITGRPVISEEAAMSTTWCGETRAYTLNG